MIKRAGVLTGGGDCPGLNAVIRAITRQCIVGNDVECMGILRGWRGLLDGLVQPLTLDAVSGILPRGGTILRTSQTNPFTMPDGPQLMMRNVKRFELDAVLAVGGCDTMAVAHRMHSEHGLNVIGIPTTIDNDVYGTEYTFGFDSTVNIAMEAIDRIHTTAESHDRVMIVEVMGRMAGWIATYAGLAGGADIILIPERPFTISQVSEAILKRHEKGKDFSIVVVAEGARIAERPENGGTNVIQDAQPDEFGQVRLGGVGAVLAQEIERRTGFETRVTVLGHIQRGGVPTAFDRVLGSRFGVAAVDLAVKGEFGRMVALQANKIVAIPLESVSGQRKTVPDDIFIVSETFF